MNENVAAYGLIIRYLLMRRGTLPFSNLVAQQDLRRHLKACTYTDIDCAINEMLDDRRVPVLLLPV